MKSQNQKTANQKTTIIHATYEIGSPSLCQAVRETTEDNSTELVGETTCKRCLKALEGLKQLQPVEPKSKEPKSKSAKPKEPKSKEPKSKEPKSKSAKPKSAKPKSAKPTTVHLHDTDRHPVYGTWCKIPGQHTTDPDAVTCKVCRAHIDGIAPLNAVPEQVKQARKAFRSFVARVAYMVYMDGDCSVAGNWAITHTNMAGTQYAVTSMGITVDGEDLGFAPGKDIKEWMERNWSCGEDK